MAVLNEMLLLGLQVKVIPILTREQVVSSILKEKYDVLVSNGCPYILPISKLGKHIFINIHPSLLPKFKGKSPIKEAFREKAQMGATCHYMIDEVDSGEIISQVTFDCKELDECYRQSYKAEAKVFRRAYKKLYDRGTIK